MPAVSDADSWEGLLQRARRAASLGDSAGAMSLYAASISKGCTSPSGFNDLGSLLAAAGQIPAAVVQFEIAYSLAPTAADVRRNLCTALETMASTAFHSQRRPDAVAAYTRLAAIDSESPISQTNAGMALRDMRAPARALSYLRRAAALAPQDPVAHFNLGSVLFELSHREAEAELTRAIELDPRYADALVNLAAVCSRMGQLTRAESLLMRALRVNSDHGEAHAGLAGIRREQGDLDSSLEHYRRSAALLPQSPRPSSNYLLARQGDPGADAAILLAEHVDWAKRFASPVDPGPAGGYRAEARDRSPGRQLRIGYLSGDFRNHAVAAFIEPILAAHDRTQVHVTCYSDASPDLVTLRIQTAGRPDLWRDVRELGDEALAQRIAADEIDVLIDLAGHTACNRLLTFARRPAPIQVTYCGYPGTTGLEAIGWRLTDAVADPAPGSDGHHVERLWRLPHGFLCFQPNPAFHPPAPVPSLAHGYATFGSFNNLSKVGGGVLTAWAEILRRVPRSHLLLKSRALSDQEPRDRLRRAFSERGIDPGRIDFASYAADSVEHCDRYAQVDVALDPFPYNGATTTCEALWMGVPVLTLAGTAHAGRVGASLLAGIGCPELVAETLPAYIEAAVALATDAGRLAGYRAGLRDKMRAAPLLNPAVITRDIEMAYREMWRLWCCNPTPVADPSNNHHGDVVAN